MSWLIVPSLVAAVVLFVANSICWMVLKHHMSDFLPTPGRAGIEAAAKGLPPGGFYSVPHMTDFPLGWKDPAFGKRFETGPNLTIVVGKPGPCMGPSTFVKGFVLNVVEAVSLVCILRGFGGLDLARAAGYGAMLGTLVRGTNAASQAIWMGFPWPYAGKVAFDGALGYGAAAAVAHLVG